MSTNETAFNIFTNYTITAIVFCSCIFIPISIYSLRKLWLVSDNLIFKKRQSSITILFVIFGIINFILLDILFMARIFGMNRRNGFGSSFTTHIFIQYCLTFIIIACIFLCRVYINYFDINYSKIIINNEWKSLINKNNINQTQTQNWFILHKNTYGNAKHWVKYIIFIYFLSLFIFYFYILVKCNFNISNLHLYVLSIHNNISQRREISSLWNRLNIITILIALPSIISLAIIRYKTPTFSDNFFVKTEINYILLNVAICVPLNIPVFIIEYFINDFWIKHMVDSIPFFIYTICVFGIILIHTLWPIKRNSHWLLLFKLHSKASIATASPRTVVQLKPLHHFTKNSDIVKLSTYHLSQMRDDATAASYNDNEEELASVQSIGSTSAVHNDNLNVNVLLEMDSVFKTEQGFGSFMFHLSREFSVEILISLIEFIQYKLYIMENGIQTLDVDIAAEHEKYLDKYGVLFKQKELIQNDVIPQSQVVSENNFNNTKFAEKYQSVYEKYLERLAIYDEENMNKFKLLFECMISAYYLFCNYVDVNAITEINIRYSTRSQLTDIFGGDCNQSDDKQLLRFFERRITERLLLNDDVDTLLLNEIMIFYQIFDESADEMIKLLTFSFIRFRETSLYKKLISDTH